MRELIKVIFGVVAELIGIIAIIWLLSLAVKAGQTGLAAIAWAIVFCFWSPSR